MKRLDESLTFVGLEKALGIYNFPDIDVEKVEKELNKFQQEYKNDASRRKINRRSVQ